MPKKCTQSVPIRKSERIIQRVAANGENTSDERRVTFVNNSNNTADEANDDFIRTDRFFHRLEDELLNSGINIQYSVFTLL